MKTSIYTLFEKYLKNHCSKDEIKILLEYFKIPGNELLLKQLILAELQEAGELDTHITDVDQRLDAVYRRVQGHILKDGQQKGSRWWISWPRTAAAAILVLISFGIYFYMGYTGKPDTQYANINIKNDIAPGGNKAILTLADGRKISLTDATDGELAEQSGIRITKAADGQLIYTISDLPAGRSGLKSHISNPEYNTIETPRGGQYQVILPDGTKVWLNATSSLKYPTSFASHKRKVELNGEAYFEVAKDKSHPFVVNTDKQEIEVLGTHFNVNSYADEGLTKTTLLEGSVKVYAPFSPSLLKRTGVRLQPGQQSVLTDNGISVSDVNTEEAMAWKNGYFMFESENIKSIMRKIERWYDVEVVFNGDIPTDKFGGTVSRFSNVSQVLKKLELTNRVQFKIEAMPDGRPGRRIMVSR